MLPFFHFRENAGFFHLLFKAAQSDIETVLVFIKIDTWQKNHPLGTAQKRLEYSPVSRTFFSEMLMSRLAGRPNKLLLDSAISKKTGGAYTTFLRVCALDWRQ